MNLYRGIKTQALLALATLLLLGASASPAAVESQGDELRARVNHAQRTYDLDAAVAARDAVRVWAEHTPSDASGRLLGQASLLVAELYRIDFEEAKEAGRPEKRELGKLIDAAAQEGLSALQPVPPDSEVYRMQADLVGTMIRSDFQAQKHHAKMDDLIAKALTADPKNARAYVTASKPFLFAPEHHGKDLAKGIEKLNQALALDPTLESALLLRAFAYEHQGARDRAIVDWKAALAHNPTCKPALAKVSGEKPSAAPGAPEG